MSTTKSPPKKKAALQKTTAPKTKGKAPAKEKLQVDMELVNKQFASVDIGSLHENSPEFEALEKAHELFWAAQPIKSAAAGIRLGHKLLKISPLHMDAYTTLGRYSPDKQVALELFQKALTVGENLWGEEFFEDLMGNFWLFPPTRPYMRALHGIMTIYREMGDTENTIRYCERILELNENDNMGMRYILLPILIEKGDAKKAEKLFKFYKGDYSAAWYYGRALLDFRKHGDSKKANKSLNEAFDMNRHVPRFITKKKKMPAKLPPYYQPGQESEAIAYMSESMSAWENTPEAVEWIAKQLASK